MIIIILIAVLLSVITIGNTLVIRSSSIGHKILSSPITSITSITRLYSEENEKKAWQMVEAKTAREKASFSNKIPFNEDMYKVLKKAIELLSKRSTDKTPVTKNEAEWFADAINVIIDDAKKFGPPPKPPRRTEG